MTRSSDFNFQARSSIELAKKFKQIKEERIDKLHERLQRNNIEEVQEVYDLDKSIPAKKIERLKVNKNQPPSQTKKDENTRQPKAMESFVESTLRIGTSKEKADGKTIIDKVQEKFLGNNRKEVQEVYELEKNIAAKKKERLKVNQNQSPFQRKREENTRQSEAMEGFDESTLKVGTSRKRAHGKTRDEVQEVDGNLDKNIVAKKILIPSTESEKHDQQKLSLDTIISKTQCSKKVKRVPTCPSMLIDDFIQLQQSKEMVGTKSLNTEKSPNNCHPNSNEPLVKVKQNQPPSRRTREEGFAQVEGDINQEEVTTTNRAEDEGTSKRKTRGRTLCKGIHARTMEEREVVSLNEDGQPIGPTDRAISNLSLFLGTLARNSTFCPLIYTSWTYMPDENIKRIWKYTNTKFILPDEAQDWVKTTARDAWRRYKCQIKKDHFLKYSNTTQRLKHCPPKVPESHFRKLCEYWSLETIQSISKRNTLNRSRQKWRHRMGPKNFGIIRAKMAAKGNIKPSQAEVFIETRKGNKGKQLDEETENAISQLQGMIENNEESNVDAFQAVFGKEHPGSMRCFGRIVTQSSLKRKAKINALKKAHNEEVTLLNEKMQNMEDKMSKFQYAFKAVMKHCNPGISMESLEDMLGLSPEDANSAQKVTRQPRVHSSTSTHVPNFGKQGPDEGDTNEEWQADAFGF